MSLSNSLNIVRTRSPIKYQGECQKFSKQHPKTMCLGCVLHVLRDSKKITIPIPRRVIENSKGGGGGSSKPKILKECMNLTGIFRGVEGFKAKKKTSVGGVYLFSGTTHCLSYGSPQWNHDNSNGGHFSLRNTLL